MKKLLPLCIVAALLCSCAKDKEIKNAEAAYLKAKKDLDHKNYIEAAENFLKIEDEYPFSRWALKGQVMAVYAYYKEEEYDDLVQVVDDFVRLNPANENVPYLLYMKGRSFYNQIPNIDRAQDYTQQASYVFRELIARYPQSGYAMDAKEKLPFIDEHLAGAKMSIGRYQMNQKNYVGAIKNFNEVITLYRNSRQRPEAYFRLVEIYYKIGVNYEAFGAYNHLKSYYPQSTWTKMAHKINPRFFK